MLQNIFNTLILHTKFVSHEYWVQMSLNHINSSNSLVYFVYLNWRKISEKSQKAWCHYNNTAVSYSAVSTIEFNLSPNFYDTLLFHNTTFSMQFCVVKEQLFYLLRRFLFPVHGVNVILFTQVDLLLRTVKGSICFIILLCIKLFLFIVMFYLYDI